MRTPRHAAGHARRTGAASPRGTAPFRGFVDLQPLLQARPGERVLVLGPRSRLDAALASQVVGPGGSVIPFDGAVPFPFPFRDERFDAALVAWPVGRPADLAVAAHELFRVLAPGGRAILVGPAEAILEALFEHCGFTSPTVLARRRPLGDAVAGSQTVVVAVTRPR